MNTDFAIQTKNITKKFSTHTAVDSVNLTVKRGEIFCLLGPNGAGKTTLIRMLATLSGIDGGSATVFGYDVQKQAQAVRSNLGLTGQYATVDEELTAEENLNIFCRLNGLTMNQGKLRTRELLNEFSLMDAKNRPLKKFSGGMRRRLDLAISLITKPPLIILDEPTTGLDPRTRGEMWTTIKNLVASGSTILLTTQYLEEADQLADQIAIIDHGKIIAEGTPDSLKQQLENTRFELSLKEEAQVLTTKGLMEEFLKQPVTINMDEHLLSVPLTSTHLLTQLLVTLENEQVAIEQFSVKKPTLDEVFLTLTSKG